MSGFALRTNQDFEWDGVLFRIDRVHANDEVLLQRIDDGGLQLIRKDKLLSLYSAGKIQAKADVKLRHCLGTPSFSRPIKELPARIRVCAERSMAYVRALIETGDPKFTKGFTKPLIQQVANKINDPCPPSASTLFRWYTRYRATKDVRALVPRFDRRGSRTLRQKEEVLELLSQATEEAFKMSPRAKCDDIYVRLKGKIEHENRSRIGGDVLKAPSLRTVYRLLQKIEYYDQLVLREGQASAERRCRINGKGVTTNNILERVEIDHTPLDLFLIDQETWLPLGRPVLTMLIDHYSRMPLGYYLSFGGTSAAAVIGALRHAVLPKPRTREVLEKLKVEHAWPCYGIPQVVVADNGLEFHGIDFESVAYDLGEGIQYCPKRTPRFKGVIERFLKTINYSFAHQLPGTSMARLSQRGDYDSGKHALLTLAEFIHVLEKWILDVYSQTEHRGIKVTPWSKWQDGLQRVEPVLPDSVDAFKQRIGLIAERSVRRDGIWLNSLRYSGDALGPIIRKFGEGVRVRVLYDPEDLGAILIWAPDQQDPVEVQAADYEYAKGLNSFQHELVCKKVREQGASTENREARDRAKYEIAQEIESLMVSRKLGHRRQSAKARGITSTDPAPAIPIQKSQPSQVKRVRRTSAVTSSAAQPNVELPVLPSFKLTRKEFNHD